MGNAETLGVIYSTEPFWALAADSVCSALAPTFKINRFPLRSLKAGLALKREIARAVRAAGESRLLFFSSHPDLLPNCPRPYMIFSDATLMQSHWIRERRPPGPMLKRKVMRVRKLAKGPHVFCCFSRFAEHGVAEEYRVPLDRIALLPFPIDTEIASAKPKARVNLRRLLVLWQEPNAEAESLYRRLASDQALGFEVSSFSQAQGLAPADLESRFNDQDVVLAASQREPFYPAALQAMAGGCSVLIPNSGAANEIVRDGLDGFLLDRDVVRAARTALETYRDDLLLLERHQREAAEQVKERNSFKAFASAFGRLAP